MTLSLAGEGEPGHMWGLLPVLLPLLPPPAGQGGGEGPCQQHRVAALTWYEPLLLKGQSHQIVHLFLILKCPLGSPLINVKVDFTHKCLQILENY